MSDENMQCSFCFKGRLEVDTLIQSPSGMDFICSECVKEFKEGLNDEQSTEIFTE